MDNEDDIFARLESVEKVSVDPELTSMLEIIAIAQKRLEEHPEQDMDIIEDLNSQAPWIDELVVINGEVFGPLYDSEGHISDALVQYIDETVTFKGFNVINKPIYVDGQEVLIVPVIGYVFLMREDISANDEAPLLVRAQNFLGVAYIENMHMEPLRPSIAYYSNVAREYAPHYVAQIESIMEATNTPTDALLALREMTMAVPTNTAEREAMSALLEYAYRLLAVDRTVPYAIEVDGTLYTDSTVSDDVFDDEPSVDEQLASDDERMNIRTVYDTSGDTLHALVMIEGLTAMPLPMLDGDKVIKTDELYWAFELSVCGDEANQDDTRKLEVPAPNVTALRSLRDEYVRSRI
jgi:hypothetical protein